MNWSKNPSKKHRNFEELCSEPGWLPIEEVVSCFPFGPTKTAPCFISAHDAIVSMQGVRPSEGVSEYLLSTQLSINPEGFIPPNFWCAGSVKVSQELNLEEPAFFGTRSWAFNYQHFLVEALPLYFICNKYLPDIRSYIVCDIPFAINILSYCFPDINIIPIDKDTACKVKGTIIWSPPVARNFAVIPEVLIDALKHLRKSVLSSMEETELFPKESNFSGPLFLKREIDAGNAGNARVMLNQDELISTVLDIGGQVISFEKLGLIDKAKTLYSTSSRKYITTTGANLMNFIFAPVDSNILSIKHPVFGNYWWFEKIIESVSKGKIAWIDPAEVREDGSFLVDASVAKSRILSC